MRSFGAAFQRPGGLHPHSLLTTTVTTAWSRWGPSCPKASTWDASHRPVCGSKTGWAGSTGWHRLWHRISSLIGPWTCPSGCSTFSVRCSCRNHVLPSLRSPPRSQAATARYDYCFTSCCCRACCSPGHRWYHHDDVRHHRCYSTAIQYLKSKGLQLCRLLHSCTAAAEQPGHPVPHLHFFCSPENNMWIVNYLINNWDSSSSSDCW